jgi:outer membrane protein TolC
MRRTHLFPAMLLAVLLPTAAGGYDLQAYLKLVEANSKDLQLARRDITAAQADVRAARAAVFPALGASVSYLRNLTPLYYYQGGQKTELTGDNNQFALGIQASQNLFNLQAFSGMRASDEYRTLSTELFDVQRSAILSAAKKAFYQALLLEQVYQVRKASEENALENYRNAQSRYENGLVSQLAALQAEVAWKTKIPETTLARKNLDIAMLNLKDLAGLAEDQELRLEGDLGDYPPLPQAPGMDKVLEARPDYRALLAQHRLRQIEVEAARAQAYPTVAASVQYGFSAQSDKLRLEQENNALQLQLSVTVPIYSGGYVASQIDKAENEVARSLLSLEKKRREVSIDLDGLSLRLREAHERILSAQTTAATAEKALSITRASLESGLATQLDLKDAQVSYDGARLGYYSAIYDYLDAFFDWEQTTGRAPLRNE